MSVCVYVCVFSIQIQTAGWIWMRFGMEVVLGGGKVFFWGGGFDPVPHPPGMSGYLNMLESSNKTLQLITFKNLIWIILGSAG